MPKLVIRFPTGDYEYAETCMYRSLEWVLVNNLKGHPEIKGKIIKPRYKGQSVNVASASPQFLQSKLWTSSVELFFDSQELFDVLRDMELPRDGELTV